jgi:hypothetical protein
MPSSDRLLVSGTHKSIKKAIREVWDFLQRPELCPPGRPILAVFDIDDTLIFDRGDDTGEYFPEVSSLLRQLRFRMHAKIALITAREDAESIRMFTLDQVQRVAGIVPGAHYDKLFLCPPSMRASSATISQFKHAARRQFAHEYHAPIALTVGDQWTDIVRVESDKALGAIEKSLGKSQFHVVWPGDRVSLVGLKLDPDFKDLPGRSREILSIARTLRKVLPEVGVHLEEIVA